jgi:arsenate reductase
MAQALWESLAGARWEAASAGSRPSGYVHPLAIKAMQELELDISANTSKSLDRFQHEAFDLVVTVCDNARESCPVFPGAKARVHWPFDDPAVVTGTEEERMIEFRRVRDAIRDRIATFLVRWPGTIAGGDLPENAST